MVRRLLLLVLGVLANNRKFESCRIRVGGYENRKTCRLVPPVRLAGTEGWRQER